MRGHPAMWGRPRGEGGPIGGERKSIMKKKTLRCGLETGVGRGNPKGPAEQMCSFAESLNGGNMEKGGVAFGEGSHLLPVWIVPTMVETRRGRPSLGTISAKEGQREK